MHLLHISGQKRSAAEGRPPSRRKYLRRCGRQNRDSGILYVLFGCAKSTPSRRSGSAAADSLTEGVKLSAKENRLSSRSCGLEKNYPLPPSASVTSGPCLSRFSAKPFSLQYFSILLSFRLNKQSRLGGNARLTPLFQRHLGDGR